MKNVLTIPSIVAGSKNGGGAGGTTNYEDLTNKPKVNGIVLSGNKTSADLGITTLTPFPSTWPTTGKFEDLLAAIREDTIAVKGASFLGEVTFDDLPANLGNAEIKIEILEGTTPATKVIHSVITSGNRKPYRWEYTSWNSGNSNSGWISFQLPLTAGTGISIENNVISATGTDKYGIKGDYASKYGIINAQTGLITYSSDSKEVTVSAGLQLLMPGSETKTQIGSAIKYTINSTSDVTLFLADGEIKEAEAVYYQTEEPENGQEAYLAWWNPELEKWQFKSNDDGNVWKTPTKAGPLADIHLSDTGVVRVDYIGYRVLNDQIFALKSDIPENIYTQNNLLSGKGISIVDEPVEGGIDAHTLACWHFDGDQTDVVNGLLFSSTYTNPTYATDDYKFGSASLKDRNKNSDPIRSDALFTEKVTGKQAWTIDCWIRYYNANTNILIGPIDEPSLISGTGLQINNKSIKLFVNGKVDSTEELTWFDISWHHIALTYNYDESTEKGILNAFVDGEPTFNKDITPFTGSNYGLSVRKCFAGLLDELRISDIVRYTDKFEVPTQPYSVAEPTGNKVINSTITKTSQLTNDSGFISSVSVATTDVVGGVKPDGTTITVTEDGTISAVSSTPSNMMTTDTFQEISARKYFNEQVVFNSEVRLGSITMSNGATGLTKGTSTSGNGVRMGDYSNPAEVWSSSFNINTVNPNSGGVGAATLNGKQIATVDDITAASSGTTSVNGKSGTVVLTGADIQTTYTYNSEETTTTVDAFADAVFHDIDNVTALIPTKAVTSDNVTKIVKLTQSEYDSLTTKDENTLYYIVG